MNKKPEKPRAPFLVNKRLPAQRVPQISQWRAGGAGPRAGTQRPRQVSCGGHCPCGAFPFAVGNGCQRRTWPQGPGDPPPHPRRPSERPAAQLALLHPCPPSSPWHGGGSSGLPVVQRQITGFRGKKKPFSDSQLNLALDSAPPTREQRAAERWTSCQWRLREVRPTGPGLWAPGTGPVDSKGQ